MRKLATLGVLAAFVLSLVGCQQGPSRKDKRDRDRMNQRAKTQVERSR